MGNIGPFQILIIVGIALLLFGGSRIAGLGKGLGEGIKNFKRGLKDDDEPPAKQLPEKKKTAGGEGESEDEEKPG